MGCAFEAAREQPKQRTKQPNRNQCAASVTTATTAIGSTTTTTTTSREAEDIQIKDNYQQNHKTQTATAKANGKHQKATAQVLLATQQQQQQQQQQFCQVALDNKDALATTHETIEATTAAAAAATPTIDIEATNDLQITCTNCYSRSPEINRDEQPQQQQLQQQQRRRRRRHSRRQDHGRRNKGLLATPTTTATTTPTMVAAATTTATLAGIPCLRLHEMLLHARAALATPRNSANEEQQEQKQKDVVQQQQQPLAYRPWQCLSDNVASAVVPATMSAAILANLSATSAAAYQYLGQHYKHYSQSFSFYAASSVILMLCYLTTTSTAAATQSETGALDKHPIFDESSSDKEILDLLLEKKRYDKRLLPPVNDEDFCCGLQSPDMATNQNARRPHNRGTLTVNVNVLLLSLASPDESSLKYEVEFLLNQQWNDPRLQYGNKSHYDFLNALHHHDSIWTPDTYFIMHGDFKDPIIPMHFALRIFRNGTITYAMRRHLILSCQGSLHIFPFDDPKCSFSMESISYEEAQIKYVWKNDEDTLRKSPSLTTLNAYLIKNQTTACDQNSWRGNYSCLQVELTFTRDRAYYFTTVFIPGIILVTSSFITFWLEWNAVPARVMIGVTTMLNFFTTSNGFRSTLPVVSNLTAMNVWDGVCMCFIYASLLEFVCVNYVGRKRPLHNVVYRPGENPVTQRLPAVLSRIGVILASPLASANATPAMANTPLSTAMGTAASTATPGTPRCAVDEDFFGGGMRWQEAHGGIIGAAVQNLRARSIKRKSGREAAAKSPSSTSISPGVSKSVVPMPAEHIYEEPAPAPAPAPSTIATRVKFKDEQEDDASTTSTSTLRRSIATSTPALVVRIEQEEEETLKSNTESEKVGAGAEPQPLQQSIEMTEHQCQLAMPLKPPRRKSSRSNSPSNAFAATDEESMMMTTTMTTTTTTSTTRARETGEKRRDAGAPNEIVACTTCGGSNSPCTHSANNGCATETCFVQVRKKEPPHPIRVAKTIDVIARITFPTAYAIFLIFFFVHYKGFS
ncbi:uncharacterized protein LOC132788369 isoform X3 [Drosophila nasuta]|uniref:uncharacterized protein LOC132788369 isoform X3 n=1 Tax=Drosophila nasuta TaxID=42062 RepID=UPI00295F470A|nr:uncharacterized protein LOC132788369 isoform X3 [Drosophila nasuta]